MSKETVKTPREISNIVIPNIRTDAEARFEYDHREIKATFYFDEAPGQTLDFPFHKYKEDDVMHYSFQHGVTYTVPQMIFDHINSLTYPIYKEFNENQVPGEPWAEKKYEIVGQAPRCHMSLVSPYAVNIVEDKDYRGKSWMDRRSVEDLKTRKHD